MGRLAELQRKLLEQLMGPEAMGIVQSDVSMWDPKVCKPFIAGICPHDLFTNTKMDLGSCARTHSAKVRNEFSAALAKAEADKDTVKVSELNRILVEYEHTILAFVEECDRRIRVAQRRLEKTPEENNRTTALMREIGEIEGAYQSAMADVELLGSEGKVDESIKQLSKAEALKAEKQEKERDLQNLTETSGASGHQKLRVCDICGAYLSVLDSDRRLADHFGGKMHLGYLQLRTLMDEWRARGPLPTAASNPAPTAVKVAAPPPTTTKPLEAAPPVAFRPIPASKALSRDPPPPAAPSAPSGDRDGGRGEHRSSSRRDGAAPSDERDRERSSRRSGEERGSSSRYDDRDGGHRSSSRRYEEDDRSRRHSSRHEEGRSSRRYEEGEEREKEKRRRVD